MGRAWRKCAVDHCGSDAVDGEKYCRACRKAVLARLRDVGYLQPVRWSRPYLDPDKRHGPRRSGEEDPGFENAVRVVEGD
jgi:hypothetical protein